MRKSKIILALSLATGLTLFTPAKTKADCWGCWDAGAALVAGGIAYTHGYYAGRHYGPYYGGYYPYPAYGYYAPPPGYYYGPVYRPVRYVRQVRYYAPRVYVRPYHYY